MEDNKSLLQNKINSALACAHRKQINKIDYAEECSQGGFTKAGYIAMAISENEQQNLSAAYAKFVPYIDHFSSIHEGNIPNSALAELEKMIAAAYKDKLPALDNEPANKNEISAMCSSFNQQFAEKAHEVAAQLFCEKENKLKTLLGLAAKDTAIMFANIFVFLSELTSGTPLASLW